jgi:AbrB family looped-hinge helix DNA binding protein
MNVKIDKAGRIILPKPVRDRLQLRPGANLELQESPEGILLRPVGQAASMVQKNGIWVHLGRAPRGFDWSRAVDDAREERIKDASGL